jgi:hypothetical protein
MIAGLVRTPVPDLIAFREALPANGYVVSVLVVTLRTFLNS